MNALSLIIYLLITWFITVHVGLIFYRNGKHYILNLLHGDEKLTGFINRLLLTGYYLVNLGYVAMTLRFGKTMYSPAEMMISICSQTGNIMCLLGVMHFFNMAVLLIISHYHQIANNKQ